MEKAIEMNAQVEDILVDRDGGEVGPQGELVYPEVDEVDAAVTVAYPSTSTNMVLALEVESTEEVIEWLEKMMRIESLRRWLGQRMRGLIATALKVCTSEVTVNVSERS